MQFRQVKTGEYFQLSLDDTVYLRRKDSVISSYCILTKVPLTEQVKVIKKNVVNKFACTN